MNSKKIDEIDKIILRKLLKDARTNSSDIAKQVGLSVPSISKRIEKMEKKGIIVGTALVLNLQETKTEIALAITIKLTSKEKEEKCLKEIKKIKNVISCSTVVGNYDIIVTASVIEFEDINKIKNQINKIEGIEKIGISANIDSEFYFLENMLK
jgi:Lrp/AsnC family transcriptional regulator for asnA, asnC and gidA